GEVLGVTALMEERTPVIRPADRLDDQDDPVRHLDRGAERTRALVGTLLEVERHVLLRAQVDAEVGERAFERRHHAIRRELPVPLRGAEEARNVPALRLRKWNADARAEEPIGPVLVERLRRRQKDPALLG